MTTALTPPPSTEDKPWVWTSLGTAAMIVLCCGIAPVAIIAGIEAARDSSSSNAGKGGAVVARASQHPTPRSTAPLAVPPPPTPSASPSAPSVRPTPTPSPPAPPPQDEPDPQAIDPLPQETAPAGPQPPMDPAPPAYPAEPVRPAPPAAEEPAEGITLPLPVQTARIGDVVRTGGLEYVVRGVKCGVKQIGTDARGQQAVGQFCVVTLSVRNIGELIQNAVGSRQTAIGANGSQYSVSSLASAIANEPGNPAFLAGISPGQEVSGFVVFDLPEGVDLAQLVLPGGIKIYI